MSLKEVSQSELLRRKEIVIWQISIAKDHQIIQQKELELKAIYEQLKPTK